MSRLPPILPRTDTHFPYTTLFRSTLPCRLRPMPHHGGAAMTRSNPFPSLLRAFFQEWLVEQRSASVHTIRSYRDTWRLLLRFIAERKGGGVARVALADISADEVRAFPHHTEHGRG